MALNIDDQATPSFHPANTDACDISEAPTTFIHLNAVFAGPHPKPVAPEKVPNEIVQRIGILSIEHYTVDISALEVPFFEVKIQATITNVTSLPYWRKLIGDRVRFLLIKLERRDCDGYFRGYRGDYRDKVTFRGFCLEMTDAVRKVVACIVAKEEPDSGKKEPDDKSADCVDSAHEIIRIEEATYVPLLEWSVHISETVVHHYWKLSQSGYNLCRLGFEGLRMRDMVVQDCERVGRMLGLPEEKPKLPEPVDPGSIVW